MRCLKLRILWIFNISIKHRFFNTLFNFCTIKTFSIIGERLHRVIILYRVLTFLVKMNGKDVFTLLL